MIDHPTVCLVYTGNDKGIGEYVRSLATTLSLPLADSLENPFELQLVYTGNRLELQYNPSHMHRKQHPVAVDFLHNDAIHHRLSTFTTTNPLAKAVGVKPNYRPAVIDATAGFGMDGLCLAWIGCNVVLVERNPIVYALLQDGLRRAGRNRDLAPVINEHITLLRGDSTDILPKFSSACHAVLLDPMYPENDRKSLNRKEMRLIRQLVGSDSDHGRLFQCALHTGAKRIAVKRPKGAPPISSHPPPSYSVAMKSGRFDVYFN